MANTKPALPTLDVVAVPAIAFPVLSAVVSADIFSRTTKYVIETDRAEKAAIGLIDTLYAAGIKPVHLYSDKGDADFLRGMSAAIVAGFDKKVQALLQYTDKLPEGVFDKKAKTVEYNNGTKRYHQTRIGSRFGDIRNGLAARIVMVEAEAAKAADAVAAEAAKAATAKANAEAAKAAEAEALAKVKAAAAEAKAAKAKGSDKAALADKAAKAAEAVVLEAAAKAVADKAAAEAKVAEDAAKAAAIARVEAEIANKLRDDLVAVWKGQKEKVQKAVKPTVPVAEIVKALDALIALVMVVKK